MPVVAVHGVDDPIAPISNAQRMADELSVGLVEVDGHGHGLSGPLKAEIAPAIEWAGSAQSRAKYAWAFWNDGDVEDVEEEAVSV